MKLNEVKSHLKALSSDIRNKKSERKNAAHGYVPGLLSLRYEYRHYHIAYCLFRGKSYEQIEKPRQDNQPNSHYYNLILDKISSSMKKEDINV